MKTYLLLLFVSFTGLGLAAQPASPANPTTSTNQNATGDGGTNREAITRRLLDRLYSGDTNQPTPASAPAPLPVTPPTAVPTTAVPLPGAQPTATAATPGAPGAGTIAAPGISGGAVAPPPAIGAPGAAATASPQTVTTNAAGQSMEDIIPPGILKLQEMNLNQALESVYAPLVGRTILRPTALPAATITLKAETPLTRRESIQALDAVLALNGIATLNVGTKFVTIVPEASAIQQGKAFTSQGKDELPELGQYTTHVVQLKYAQVQEVQQAITPLAKTPASIIAIPSSSILILRDYAPNIKRMLDLIEKIDVTIPGEYEPVVIPIKYALATDIQQVLASLSPSGAGVTVGRSTQRTLPGLPTPGGIGGAQGGINPQTGQPYPGATPGGGATGTRSAFQGRLQQAVQRMTSGALAGDIQIIGQAKIIADERTNSLLIFASKTDLDAIQKVIAKLDVVLAQVLIEGIIMEVSLDDSINMGVSASQNRQQGGRFTGAGALQNGPSWLDPTTLTSLGSFSTNAAGSGLSYFGKLGMDYDVAVNLIATDSRINVLQRPRIQTSHATPAQLFIGETRPYIVGTIYSDFVGTGGSRSQVQEKHIGITLNVLPLINSEGLVIMKIEQQIQQLGKDVIIDNNPYPTTTERNTSAEVAVHDHDTIMLGGFISSTKNKAKSGVPFLKDIPLLGALFRNSSDHNARTELMVLLRPTVLPTPESASLAAAAERDKMPAIRRAEAEEQEFVRKQEEQARREEEKKRKKN
ncbi:MAG: hypothetical protein DME26_22685 [Verrucomicrobia bacterium]|nr:MAG: hypothetical protein DME26_22685 [Verrucomicrobiota bacterium]